jgi:glycosyltransferase involved in cell wall biosynthesis
MKKKIIVSAINFRAGGPLSILNDCLEYLDNDLSENYNVIALIHKESVLVETSNIEYIEFPKSIKSYFYRLYYEYIYFNKLSKILKPYLWLSLHDMSPRVQTNIQAVYCHNPSPFYKMRYKDFFVDITFTLFNLFYKYLYKINIQNNDFVIVQQSWIRKKFLKMYNIKKCIVSYPSFKIETGKYISTSKNENENKKKIFFYPSFPRIFKNFEVICEASKILNEKNINNFEVIITISGKENTYSKNLYKKYKDVESVKFIGLQTREKVFELYSIADCMIFASKLETWGLPISEFKKFKKGIFLSDLEYAHETVGQYEYVKYFNPNDANMLSEYMEQLIRNEMVYDGSTINIPSEPFSENWEQLFKILLKENNK